MAEVKPSAASVASRLAEAGLDVSAPYVAEALANLLTLQGHVATLRSFPLDPRSASALRFEP